MSKGTGLPSSALTLSKKSAWWWVAKIALVSAGAGPG
jgi:hypothetical protein